MKSIFQITISDKIYLISNYNFEKNLNVRIYNIDNLELYRTNFVFVKNVMFWIAINQLDNITVNILDEEEIIYSYTNIVDYDDFAYITCGDLYYMDLIEKLVISLLNTSNRKIIVYGINCKVPFDYPNLIKREFISPTKTIHDKWFWKQQTCIEVLKENFNNYVWLDGDIVANNNIDTISKYFSQIENYPIGEVHVQDEQIFRRNETTELLGEKICEYFGINRKVLRKDLHACFFVFNNKCKWFFEEILQLYHSIYDQGLYDKLLSWNDESLHNFMHSKYNFTKTLPLSNLSLLCTHSKYESNPQLLRLFYGYWNDDSPNNFGEVFGWSYVPPDKNQILYFHENKNLKDADEMINFIKMKKYGFYNSRYFFVDKYKIDSFQDKYKECNLFEFQNLNYLKPNDLVVDIGSDIGYFERYANLKMASKVICFEPNKEKFELLKLNSNPNSILFNADVDNVDYSINYLFYSDLIDHIDFLKIDSKGNEFSIIDGIDDINFQKINRISVKFYNSDQNLQSIFISNIMRHGYHSMNNSIENLNYIHFYKINNSLCEWMIKDGDNTLSINHNLNENSIVFDIGGYIGDWVKKIYDNYKCNLFVFEPVKSFYLKYLEPLSNDKIRCYNYGLSNENSKKFIFLSNEGSSLHKKTDNFEEIELVDIEYFIENNNLNKIDLISMNCEGEEYNILEKLISSNRIKDIINIQIQFHKISDDSINRRNLIRNELSKTHNQTYCVDFIWENWKLR